MKKTIKPLLLASILFMLTSSLTAQTSETVSVKLQAATVASPPSITISWAAVSGATPTGFTIYRKLKTGTSWGPAIATLGGSATSYLDTPVSVNTAYEYKVTRTATIGATTYTGYGYISTGINLAAVANRGILLLVIDSTFVSTLSTEISTYIADIKADGWRVKTDYVGRTASVATVKNHILKLYGEDSANTKAVILLGHVPVPYSGNFAPDGHGDHIGAWPADVYYGDINGTWTDVSVNNTSASRTQNDNIPGDGKFDQTYVPDGTVELQVGRVDLANMPAFSTKTELQLMQDYFAKDHDYRVKNYTTVQRGLVDDNFGYFGGEAFAANGWRNIAPIVGSSNVSSLDYISTLKTSSYQWAYGCGGGSYTSAGGIGNTDSFVNNSIKATFSILFGSYFGDWDASNCFLRAPLCSGTTLTNVWGGRPNWFFHHMAMGENIGYSTNVSQNNASLYAPTGFYARAIHQALMGDLTLRNDVIKPASNVTSTPQFGSGKLKWNKTTDTVLGYNVYVSNGDSVYTKLNDSVITDSTYTYACLPYATNHLYVKAVKLHTSPSGTYYNESAGVLKQLTSFVNAVVSNGAVEGKKIKYMHGYDTCNAYTHIYKWYFGDGTTSTQRNPTHAYASYGSYTVSLVVKNGCQTDSQSAVYNFPPPLLTNSVDGAEPVADEMETSLANGGTEEVEETLGLKDALSANGILTTYPNPSSGVFTVAMVNNAAQITTLRIYDITGKKVVEMSVNAPSTEVNITKQAKGIYYLVVADAKGQRYYQKIVLQ